MRGTTGNGTAARGEIPIIEEFHRRAANGKSATRPKTESAQWRVRAITTRAAICRVRPTGISFSVRLSSCLTREIFKAVLKFIF